MAQKKTTKTSKKPADVEPAEAPGAPLAAASTTAEASPVYTWDDVLARIGPASAADQELYGVDTDAAELVESGRRLASEKILTDLLRWLGDASSYLAQGGSPSAIRGFHPGMLRVLAADASKLRELVGAARGARGEQDTQHGGNAETSSAATDRAARERDALSAALLSAFSKSPADRVRVTNAGGAWKKPSEVASSLDALVRLAQSTLGKPGVAAKKLAQGGVDADYLDRLAALARDVRASGELTSGARARVAVSQAELDAQDGRCLEQMAEWLSLFEAAHALDPRVPRLLPIATRSFFRHRAAPSPAPAPDPATPPAPAPAAGATT